MTEPAPDDIRETSTPDAGERADPDKRRRVPPPDETDTTVDRAHLALDEIEARRQAEAAHDATDHDAAPELDDDTRRAELDRWVDQDTTEQDDAQDDGPTRERGWDDDTDE